MMSTKKRLVMAARAGTFCVFALLLQVDAKAADVTVPKEWNVGPMSSGAYREAFDSSLPTWAGRVGANAVTNGFPAMSGSGLPVRSNAWFGANVKVLQLETDGETVTNEVAYGDGPVTFAAKPVYVDLRIKFDPLTDAPNANLLSDAKLALFVSPEAKLVVVHKNGAATNSLALDTNKWHQITVKLFNNKFDVLTNDVAMFTNLEVRTAGTANTLSSANFYGTGLIDELYVSHGNPAYPIPGPTNAIPTLPTEGANTPTDEQQTMINAWLSGYAGITSGTALSMTKDQLNLSYLLDKLNGDGTTATPVGGYSFGISKLDLISPTSLIVTVALKVDNVDKASAINGRIQLQGKVDIEDSWTTLDGAITPEFADFDAGEATYTFTVRANGYRFFKPLIVP